MRLSLNRGAYLEASSNGDVDLACACPAAARFGEQLPRSAPCSRTSPQAGGCAADSGVHRNRAPASARGLRCPRRCRAGRSSRGAGERHHCDRPQPRVAQGGGTRRQQPQATTGSRLQLLGRPWMGKVSPPLHPPQLSHAVKLRSGTTGWPQPLGRPARCRGVPGKGDAGA